MGSGFMKRLLGLCFVALTSICYSQLAPIRGGNQTGPYTDDKLGRSDYHEDPVHVYAKIESVGQDRLGNKGAILTPILPPSLEVVLEKGDLPKPKDFVDCAAYAVNYQENIQIIEMKCGETVFRVSRILFQQEEK